MTEEGEQKQDLLRTDGGDSDDRDENPEPSSTEGKAEQLTNEVNSLLDGQLERQARHNREVEEKEQRAQNEVSEAVSEYEELQAEAPEAVDWDLSTETPAEDLTDVELTHEAERGAKDYVRKQSERAEGLSGSIGTLERMMGDKRDSINELEDQKDDLEDERESRKEDVTQQITQMDEDEFRNHDSPTEMFESEAESIDSEIDRKQEELEEEIEGHRDDLNGFADKKKPATDERETRREETAEVYGAFDDAAEQAAEANVDVLEETLGVLNALRMQDEAYGQKSVEANDERATLDQNQDAVADEIEDTARLYAAVALESLDELEDTVRDHERVTEEISAALNLEEGNLDPVYEDLADPSALEDGEGYEEGDLGVIRERVLSTVGSITGASYDADRELRDIADDLQEEYGN